MQGIVVLISGRGSNLQAICAAQLKNQIKCVISNKADAKGLEFAKANGIPIQVIEHTKFTTRAEFDQTLAACVDEYKPQLIVLAGFMRILTPWFVNKYPQQIINIHPSILPAFIGAHAQAAAVAAKVKISGATVHFVTEQLDHGPIIVQGVVPVQYTDNTDDLSHRILDLEHIIYPFAIRKILAGQMRLIGKQEIFVDKLPDDEIHLGKYVNHVFY
jgi:phosphoribosylglycinamide formyltransferase 1